MNAERLKQLTERAEKATAIAADIEQLNKANPFEIGSEVRFRMNGADRLDATMLKDVIARGRASIIAEKEAELEQLLGGAQSDAEAVPVIIPSMILAPSMPDTNAPRSVSDPFTSTPPAQPFATISCLQ